MNADQTNRMKELIQEISNRIGRIKRLGGSFQSGYHAPDKTRPAKIKIRLEAVSPEVDKNIMRESGGTPIVSELLSVSLLDLLFVVALNIVPNSGLRAERIQQIRSLALLEEILILTIRAYESGDKAVLGKQDMKRILNYD